MSNRLRAVTEQARQKGRKLFCAFVTAGYPNLEVTGKLIEAFEKEGVDIIELGFPFSDPLADGPTIQFSSEQALRKGVRISAVFKLVRKLRKKGVRTPIVFFSYFNPVFHHPGENFLKEASSAGFDGILIPDLPPDYEKDFSRHAARRGLEQIFLIAPTTAAKRAEMLARKSRGFIYYVSLRGVTGARKALPSGIRQQLLHIKSHAPKPVLVGFGVSTPDQARKLCRFSDGVIVGSAIMDLLRRSRGRIPPVVSYIRKMVRSVHGSHYDSSSRR